MPTAAALLALLLFQAEPILFEAQDELVEFTYGWAPVVEEEPGLRALLEEERSEALARAREWAAEDRAARRESGFDFGEHSYSKVWEAAGVTPRLISLTAETGTYTGGAHGNYSFSTALWDRGSARLLEPRDLLGDDVLARIEPAYCDAVDAMRAERRGEPVRRDPEDGFTACPALTRQRLAFADADGDGRLETLQVLIPPYEAGPWVEGSYVVEMPLQAEDLGGLDPAYRPSFEAAGPRPRGERG